MKTFALFLNLILLFCFNSFGQAYMKLDKADVDLKKVEIARKFADDYHTQLKNNSYYQFKDEAIDILKNQLTEEVQKAGYKQIKDNFGDYKSLAYAETWIQRGNAAFKIYRFKGEFDKSDQKLEIRIILNNSDEVAGFWIKPWNDMLN